MRLRPVVGRLLGAAQHPAFGDVLQVIAVSTVEVEEDPRDGTRALVRIFELAEIARVLGERCGEYELQGRVVDRVDPPERRGPAVVGQVANVVVACRRVAGVGVVRACAESKLGGVEARRRCDRLAELERDLAGRPELHLGDLGSSPCSLGGARGPSLFVVGVGARRRAVLLRWVRRSCLSWGACDERQDGAPFAVARWSHDAANEGVRGRLTAPWDRSQLVELGVQSCEVALVVRDDDERR